MALIEKTNPNLLEKRVTSADYTTPSLVGLMNDLTQVPKNIKVKATEDITKGDVLKATGYDETNKMIEVQKTSLQTDIAVGLANTSFLSGDFGYAQNLGILEGVDTSSFAFSDLLYTNTSGTYTNIKPEKQFQAIGTVLKSDAKGIIMVNITEPKITEFDYQVDASTGTKYKIYIDNGNITLEEIE